MRSFVVLASILAAASAHASECPSGGDPSLLKVLSWEAHDEGDRVTTVVYTYENTSPKQIDMVKASLWFTDALGGQIGPGLVVDPDPKVAAGGKAEADWRGWGLERLLKVDKKNVAAQICVKSVLYDDGSKDDFTNASD